MAYTQAGTWTQIDYPGATRTEATGISGGNIVGTYRDSTIFIMVFYMMARL